MDPANTVYVSAVSGWELAIKAGLGRLDLPKKPVDWLPRELERSHFVELPISLRHALAVAELPQQHQDPFDRLLVSQATAEELVLVTSDPKLRHYKVRLLAA